MKIVLNTLCTSSLLVFLCASMHTAYADNTTVTANSGSKSHSESHVRNTNVNVGAAAAAGSCAGVVSIGIGAMGAGAGIGIPKEMKGCSRRENALTLKKLGHRRAGVEVMCTDKTVRAALAATGYRCTLK
jgi:hypothetical protein